MSIRSKMHSIYLNRKYNYNLIFYAWFHLHGYCLVHILKPFPPLLPLPLSFISVPPEPPSPLTACDSMWLQPLFFILYRICTRAQVLNLQSLKKWPPAHCSNVQAAKRRSPIQVKTQCQAVWLGWSPLVPENYHRPNSVGKYSYK